jgi:tetratricopeptide (TPR) repeat protein
MALVAICLLGPLVAQPPGPQLSLAEQAIVAERRGDPGAAADLYLKLIEASPGNPEWVVAAGRCMGLAQRYNDAIDLLNGRRERFPDAVEIPAMLARTFLLKAEGMLSEGIRDLNVELYLRDAVSTCEEILSAAPGHRDSRLILTQSLLQMGEREEALRQAEETVRRFPDHPGGHILLGRISFDDFAALRRRITASRPTGQVQADMIQSAYELREKARQAFESAIKADPTRPFPHKMLGNLQSWLGNTPAALGHYRQALVIDPQTSIDHAWVAQNIAADQRLSFYDATLQEYRQRSDANPANTIILDFHAARALMDKESWADAQGRFEKVLRYSPSDPGSLYYAMISAFWAEDMEAAEKHAAAHAVQSPAGFADLIRGLADSERENSLTVLSLLARQSYEAERLDNGRDINRVLAYVTNTVVHWNNYAFLCRETERFEDSLAAYRRALRIEPDSPQLLNDAGVILQYHLTGTETREQARAYYKRAIAVAEELLQDPDTAPESLELARQAMRDAEANLKQLDG